MNDRRGGIRGLVRLAFWVLLIVYVVNHPSEAAANARSLAGWVQSTADSIATFLQHSSAGAR